VTSEEMKHLARILHLDHEAIHFSGLSFR
jgi:hypothetical protein